MSLLKTGQCFTEELALNCPTIVACVTALPTGPAAVAGDRVLGKDGQYHALPAAPAQVPQTLALTGQTLTLSNGGGSVTLPDSDAQALSIAGNVISLTNGGSVTLPTTAAPVPQTLSIAGNTVSMSGGGGSVTIPDNDAQALSIAGNVISLTNGGSVTLPAAATVAFATPAETVAGASTTLAVNPADLYARENIAAQAGLNANPALIPAPTASQSPWGTNTLGETVHYAPGLGWKIVDNYLHVTQNVPSSTPVAAPAGSLVTVTSYTAQRAGLVVVTANTTTDTQIYCTQSGGISVGGALVRFDNSSKQGPAFTAVSTGFYLTDANNASTSWTGRVAAGTVIANSAICVDAPGTAYGNLTVTYIGQ